MLTESCGLRAAFGVSVQLPGMKLASGLSVGCVVRNAPLLAGRVVRRARFGRSTMRYGGRTVR